MWYSASPLFYQLSFILLITLIVHLFEVRYLRVLLNAPKKLQVFSRLAWLRALQKPLTYFIYLGGVSIAIEVLRAHFPHTHGLELADKGKMIAMILLIVWCLVRLTFEYENYYLKSRSLDKTTVQGIARLVRLAWMVIGVIVLLDSLGYRLNGLLALGGAGTILTGIAAKDLLANWFGGVIIYWDRPFSEGETIRSADGRIEGVVEQIGWRVTRLVSPEGQPIYVPNSYFSQNVVENITRIRHRLLKIKFGLRYLDALKLPALLQEMNEWLKVHPKVDSTKKCMVHLTALGDSALECTLQAVITETDIEAFRLIQQNIFMQLFAIVSKHQADMAFPTMTIHVPDPVCVTNS